MLLAQACDLPTQVVIDATTDVSVVYDTLDAGTSACVLFDVDHVELPQTLSTKPGAQVVFSPAPGRSHVTAYVAGNLVAQASPSNAESGLTFRGVTVEPAGNGDASGSGGGDGGDAGGADPAVIALAAVLGILMLVNVAVLIVRRRRAAQGSGGRKREVRLCRSARDTFSSLMDGSTLIRSSQCRNAGELTLLARDPRSIRVASLDVKCGAHELWRATFVENMVPLYVKRAQQGRVMDDKVMEQLLLEAQLMTMLDTKFVVQFYGYTFTRDEGVSLLYAYPNGGTLRVAVKQHLTTQDSAERVGVLIKCLVQVAQAIEYLHTNDVVHGSLSADAVYVTANLHKARIAGFCPSSGKLGDSELLQPPETPRIKWVAPECVEQGRMSKEGDVWSFGVLCWEAFSQGTTPFDSVSGLQAYSQMLHGHRLDLPSDCPSQVYDLMLHAWNASPSDRPHAHALVKQWQQALQSLTSTGYARVPSTYDDGSEAGDDVGGVPPQSSLRDRKRRFSFLRRISTRNQGYVISGSSKATAANLADLAGRTSSKRRWADTYGPTTDDELFDPVDRADVGGDGSTVAHDGHKLDEQGGEEMELKTTHSTAEATTLLEGDGTTAPETLAFVENDLVEARSHPPIPEEDEEDAEASHQSKGQPTPSLDGTSTSTSSTGATTSSGTKAQEQQQLQEKEGKQEEKQAEKAEEGPTDWGSLADADSHDDQHKQHMDSDDGGEDDGQEGNVRVSLTHEEYIEIACADDDQRDKDDECNLDAPEGAGNEDASDAAATTSNAAATTSNTNNTNTVNSSKSNSSNNSDNAAPKAIVTDKNGDGKEGDTQASASTETDAHSPAVAVPVLDVTPDYGRPVQTQVQTSAAVPTTKATTTATTTAPPPAADSNYEDVAFADNAATATATTTATATGVAPQKAKGHGLQLQYESLYEDTHAQAHATDPPPLAPPVNVQLVEDAGLYETVTQVGPQVLVVPHTPSAPPPAARPPLPGVPPPLPPKKAPTAGEHMVPAVHSQPRSAAPFRGMAPPPPPPAATHTSAVLAQQPAYEMPLPATPEQGVQSGQQQGAPPLPPRAPLMEDDQLYEQVDDNK
ncbi:TK protein kinase [Salpingoeca rosetta]|uniref:TK protein kinase n=1 Tax=Salpingoeca rosetta (strain ATCC 50818 / BSB-021) TaxID=946362 RepID=F2TXD5_SALR5|nr:TK protein kinase [Salpingoeca rosetta]EGD76044.1 TK protein kinase [Salpingoeca rosetta]|eukprot:XP_004998219.1 TK protein kinase [Salpingoeca rosetta]